MRPAVVVMGVSGTGKTTVGEALAQRLGLHFVEGDALHSAASVDKMRRGEALADDDRWSWLDRIGAALAAAAAAPAGVVVSCSALKRAYRDRLRAACPGVHFLFLDGEAALIAMRLHERSGHYMPPALLASQLGTLERPGADEPDATHIDIGAPAPAVADAAVAALAALISISLPRA